MRWVASLLCALSSLLCALWCGVVLAAPAGAANPPLPPQSVPTDVARVFADETLAWANALEPGSGKPTHTYTSVGAVREVFGFTGEFLSGKGDVIPIRSLNQWSAALLAGDKPVAVATVAMESGAYRTVGVAGSADLAAGLALGPDGYYVEGQPSVGTWVLNDDGTLAPADDWARRISATPIALTDAQPLLTAGWRSSQSQGGIPMWGLVLIGVVGLAGTMTTIALLTRPRRG